MKRHLFNNTIRTVAIIVLVACLACGVLWWIRSRDVGIADTEEPTDEQMEQYFEEYAKATAESDPENMLIVTSEKRPENYGAKNIVEAPNHTYYLMYESAETRDEAYAQFEANDSMSVEKNVKMELLDYNSWGIEQMGLDDAIDTIGYGGDAVKVAIIDTGLDVDLFRQYFPDINLTTYDVETNSTEYSDAMDNNGHGTHIAGTIAEGAPKNTSIIAIRAIRGDRGELFSTDVTVALQRARWNMVDVINMSIGAYEQVPSQKEEIDRAIDYNRTIVVAAAGNDGVSDVLYPAGYDNTISVSALNRDLSLAEYSNYGETIDFSAPGTGIVSINGVGNGTSMATPHVVAAAAVLKSFNRYLSFDATKNLLKEHIQDLGTPGWDERFGYGMIDYNGAEFCEQGGYCDEYGVFADEAPVYSRMEIDKVTLTELNYYSISNLMLTEVKLYTDATKFVTKKLQEVHDLTITGYNPEAYGLQEITISCEGLSQRVYVVNPENYTPGWEYELNNDNQVLLTRYYDLKDYNYDGNDSSVERLYVPDRINGKDVVAFANTERTVVNDDWSYVTEDSAFERSSYAHTVIREVYSPESLTMIDDETFSGFWVLEKVVMDSNAVRLGDEAFRGASRLRTIEGGIVELGEGAFTSDTLLETVDLREGMTEIPRGAFSNCYSLKDIEIPSTVVAIRNGAFDKTKSLEGVTFKGNNIKEIEGNAFSDASKLTSITLPNQLETIGYDAFNGTALTSVLIPASVTEIGSGAFSNNDNFTTVVVEAGNPNYYDVDGKAVMTEYYSIKKLVVGTRSMLIPSGTTTISSSAFMGFTTQGRLVLPDSVKYIESNAFYGCIGLTDIVIPKVEYVSYRAFERRKKDGYTLSDDAPLNAKLWVYNNNDAYNYAVDNGFNYQTLDASYARVVEPFEPGDVLNDSVSIEFYHDYGTLEDGVFTNHTGAQGVKSVKTVGQIIDTDYAGEVNCFRIGESYFVATYADVLGVDAEIRVNVTVNGEYPEYTVPMGLVGKTRTSLYTVELPEGFSWMDEYEGLWELGEQTFMAKYTPSNTVLYAPIENIPVVVEVVMGRAQLDDPVVTLDSKVYDGSYNIPSELVHIVGLEQFEEGTDYYAYAYTYENEVGTTTAVVSIYLDYNIALDYGFGDECNDFYTYFVYDYEILPEEVVPELEVDNRAEGIAEVEVLEDGITVTAEKACTVIITRDGGETYSKVVAVATGEENTYKFAFEITADVEVMVVLKGDLDMRGTLNARDSARIKYHVLSRDNPNHRDLTALELLIADVNSNGSVTARDAALVDYAILSSDNPNHRDLGW